ncbi:dihydrodiol dehydrogenase [Seminavis robusta]|uniref:Dihydrodiol dehydrogenase n=3 Tax=Seminavis robusta TaxID=568900 RepID=A0A9N8EHW6_9STRA|nr:dihydrodiol dehydrogenase [Seminavis robusta]|eukprot:Sro1218_g253360.1 dihydrodiol dehydrogenase (403) ;mRNA; f:22622-24231
MMMNLKAFLCAAAALQVANGFTAVGPSSPLRQSALFMTTEEAPTKEIKVGVIGCGRIGLVHLEATTKAPGVTPIIVSNPTVSKAEAGKIALVAQSIFRKIGFSDSQHLAMEVIEDPEVDAVWICSPSQYHAEQIKAAAANGKHVFCEKPIATDLGETVEAINACNEAGVKLMIGLQRRFDQNFKRVQEAVQKKEVGEPIMVKLCSRDPSPSVHTKFDTASCLVRYPNGVQAMIDVCRQSSFGYDQRAEVLGTQVMIQTDNVYPNTAKIYKNDFTGNADMPYDFFLSRYNEAYVTETIAFCESLVNDTPVPCTGEDGLVALIMALAADKSAEENRWVSFREIVEQVYCASPTECELLATSEVFPDGFKPTGKAADLLLPREDQQKGEGAGSLQRWWSNMVKSD